ncbi:putative DHA14-like major facilitator ABC transporter [Fusarium heterosporum]|uniref:Putative DHA14-like major facilitator ABC transporter n=1 Tax=Fusarium heterosporum TaxID=42747 RepID=A0A8H5T256_FUSHE|nr:putative DHA14-like major facilitator ABC transporter [Fusarium heterosporum]
MMGQSPQVPPITGRHACEICSSVANRRTRDNQLQDLQTRLARTEAQLAREASRSIAKPNLQSSCISTAPQSMSLNHESVCGPRAPSSTLDPLVDSSIMRDIDLFSAGADTNMTFEWQDQSTSLDPLDDLLLGRLSPKPLPYSNMVDEITRTELSTLHNYYFDTIYFSFPFLNQDRFFTEVQGDSHAIKALSYAVALAGCAHSAQQSKQAICCTLARESAERCEKDEQIENLNFLQALMFIGRFEALEGKLENSWMTLGRAVMVSKLMRLAHMDRLDGSGRCQDALTDQVLLEEKRRSFWALYILLSYVKTRTGWQSMLGDAKEFQIYLPSPGLLRSDLIALPMPFLSEISTEPRYELSSYAGCVLMVDLALRCFDHGQGQTTSGFWDDYCALVKRIDDLVGILKQHLNATSIRSDPVAFSLYLNLRATEILFHESAMSHSKEQGLPPLMTVESQRRATTAAFQISTAVRLVLPSPGKFESDIIMLQAIFIAWPLTMSLKAFHNELVNSQGGNGVNGVVASSRLLLAALNHIEASNGHWHQSGLTIAYTAMLSTTLLFAIDNTIVANIQPSIINEFGHLELMSWIGTGFALGTMFILLWGKVYGVFNIKWLYIFNIFLFEAGSAVCGTAPNIEALIIGRVIAGIGGAGMYSGTLTYVSVLTGPKEKPAYLAGSTVVWGIGSVLGPVVGGVFAASSATWRWGFYINLPIGAIFAPAYLILFPNFDPNPTKTIAQKLCLVDWINAIIFLAGSACLTVALTFGGVVYRFNSGLIIALWTITGILLVVFIVLLKLHPLITKENRIYPLHFYKQWILINMQLQVFLSSGIILAMTYYVPLYFQFIKGDGALEAGVRLLPLIMSMVSLSMLNGFLMPKCEMISIWYIGGSALSIIGSALMYTIDGDTSNYKVYGYNILVGAGAGCYIVAGFAIVQSLVPGHEIANAVSAMAISQDLGMVLFLAISGSLFHNVAVDKVGSALPGVSGAEIGTLIAGTSSAALQALSEDDKSLVISAIAGAMKSIWAFFMLAAVLSFVCACTLICRET